jgi:hypothetical protein
MSRKLLDWLIANWPFIVAIAPSIFVALTKVPKGGSVLDYFKYAMQLVSILTHRDEIGTLKSPLTLTKKDTPVVTTALVLFLLFWPLAFMVGCCKAGDQSNFCKEEKAFLDCEKAQLPADLVTGVTAAAQAVEGAWLPALTTLAGRVGPVVHCAVDAVDAAHASPVPSVQQTLVRTRLAKFKAIHKTKRK